MPPDTGQRVPPKPAAPLTFSEALHHYFAMGSALYEAKVSGDLKNAEMLQSVVDALLADITKAADEGGFGKDFRSAIWNEQGSERRTLWIRLTANRLKAAKPGLLSLELLGSAGVVVALAHYIFHADTSLALLSGLVIVAARLSLPSVVGRLATHEERKLRKLRRVDDLKPS